MLKKTLPTPFNGDRRKQRLFWSKTHSQALKELGGRASSPTSPNGGEYHCFSTWQRLQQRKCSSRPRSQHKYDFSWREWGSLHKCCLPLEPLIQATAKFWHQKVLLKSAWSTILQLFKWERNALQIWRSSPGFGIQTRDTKGSIYNRLTYAKEITKEKNKISLPVTVLSLPLVKCVVLYKII